MITFYILYFQSMIEGCYENSSKCVIVEDVVTIWSSVLETVQSLQNVGVPVKHVVIMDREQGAEDTLDKGWTSTTLVSLCNNCIRIPSYNYHNDSIRLPYNITV